MSENWQIFLGSRYCNTFFVSLCMVLTISQLSSYSKSQKQFIDGFKGVATFARLFFILFLLIPQSYYDEAYPPYVADGSLFICYGAGCQ
jgi:hypothetical protein